MKIVILVIAAALVVVVLLLILDFKKESIRRKIYREELKRLQSILDKKDYSLCEQLFKCDHEGTTIAWGPDNDKCTKCGLTWDV